MNDNRNIELIPSHENFDYYLPCDIMIHLHTAPIPILAYQTNLKIDSHVQLSLQFWLMLCLVPRKILRKEKQ